MIWVLAGILAIIDIVLYLLLSRRKPTVYRPVIATHTEKDRELRRRVNSLWANRECEVTSTQFQRLEALVNSFDYRMKRLERESGMDV